MSRDQKPGKAVMVDSGLNSRATRPVAAIDGVPATGSDLVPARAGAASASPSMLLSSIVFLLACVAGACAMAVVPAGTFW